MSFHETLLARAGGRTSNVTYPGFIAPPPGVTPNLNWEPNEWNLIVQPVCMAMTTVFMALRLATKWFIMKQIHADDYACIIAWIGSIAYSSITIAQGFLGLGIAQWNLLPSTALQFLARGYASQILYGPVAFCTKLAILLLMIRIFAIKERFVLFAKVLIGICAIYYLTITLIQVFLCQPISKAYNPKIPGKCLDSKKIFITNTAIAMVTDIVILASPIPVISRLNMSFWGRVGSIAALMAGGLACIATTTRLVWIVKTLNEKDRSKSGPPIVILSCIEIAIGVICSCLPVLPALFRQLFGSAKITETTSYGKQSGQNMNATWKSHDDWAARNNIKLKTKKMVISMPMPSAVQNVSSRTDTAHNSSSSLEFLREGV